MYNCKKCPGYCCSYPIVEVTDADLKRIAKHFGISPEQAERRFTKRAHDHDRIMRRKSDEHFGRVCRFFDRVERNCSIYPARPRVCRDFPGDYRCGYYEFLKWERRHQDDPEFVATTDNSSL